MAVHFIPSHPSLRCSCSFTRRGTAVGKLAAQATEVLEERWPAHGGGGLAESEGEGEVEGLGELCTDTLCRVLGRKMVAGANGWFVGPGAHGEGSGDDLEGEEAVELVAIVKTNDGASGKGLWGISVRAVCGCVK